MEYAVALIKFWRVRVGGRTSSSCGGMSKLQQDKIVTFFETQCT